VADGRLTVDMTLQPVGPSQTVDVVAAAGESINTVSGEVTRVVNTQQVQDLALNARNFMQLATLIPGAVLLDEDQLAGKSYPARLFFERSPRPLRLVHQR